MTKATPSNKFECDGDPTCRHAPTHVHRGSRGQGTRDFFYCDKCCPPTTCAEAHLRVPIAGAFVADPSHINVTTGVVKPRAKPKGK